MSGTERRAKIIKIMKEAEEPVSGSSLARILKVSRQVIVQDIALLRAENRNVISTTRGYLILGSKPRISRIFKVQHSDQQMENELNLIVDQGGKILNVMVEHPIYGEIKAELVIASRQDVKDFINKVNNSETTPLNKLTNGVHRHEVEAPNTAVLDKIEEILRAQNYLLDM